MTTPFDTEQGTIHILRADSSARDLYSRYAVLVDGKIVASLKRGDAVAIPVSAGRHTVRLSIDWQESPAMDVEVRRGEVVSLLARPPFSRFGLAGYPCLQLACVATLVPQVRFATSRGDGQRADGDARRAG